MFSSCYYILDKVLDTAPKRVDISNSKSSEVLSSFTRIYKLEKSFIELSPNEFFLIDLIKQNPF